MTPNKSSGDYFLPPGSRQEITMHLVRSASPSSLSLFLKRIDRRQFCFVIRVVLSSMRSSIPGWRLRHIGLDFSTGCLAPLQRHADTLSQSSYGSRYRRCEVLMMPTSAMAGSMRLICGCLLIPGTGIGDHSGRMILWGGATRLSRRLFMGMKAEYPEYTPAARRDLKGWFQFETPCKDAANAY